MRHEWLLAAKRAEVVMEWEKGKGDKEWRKQKYKKKRGIIYKKLIPEIAESLEVYKLQTTFLLSLPQPQASDRDRQLVHTRVPPSPPTTHSGTITSQDELYCYSAAILWCNSAFSYVMQTVTNKHEHKRQNMYSNVMQQIRDLAIRWRVLDMLMCSSNHTEVSHCCRFQYSPEQRVNFCAILMVSVWSKRHVDPTISLFISCLQYDVTLCCGSKNLWLEIQPHMLRSLESFLPSGPKVCAKRWSAKLDNPKYYSAQWAGSIYLIGQDGLDSY